MVVYILKAFYARLRFRIFTRFFERHDVEHSITPAKVSCLVHYIIFGRLELNIILDLI